MIGENCKPLSNLQDFSFCTEPLTAKTASWHREAVIHWNHESRTPKENVFSIAKGFGYFLAARITNVLIFPAALIDAISHVAVGAFTLLAAIPEKLYHFKKNRDLKKAGIELDAKNAPEPKFTLGGACSNFELAIKYLGISIFGTVAGVLFDPEVAANMAKAGQGILHANVNSQKEPEEQLRFENRNQEKGSSTIEDKLEEAQRGNLLLQQQVVDIRKTNEERGIHIEKLIEQINQLEEEKRELVLRGDQIDQSITMNANLQSVISNRDQEIRNMEIDMKHMVSKSDLEIANFQIKKLEATVFSKETLLNMEYSRHDKIADELNATIDDLNFKIKDLEKKIEELIKNQASNDDKLVKEKKKKENIEEKKEILVQKGETLQVSSSSSSDAHPLHRTVTAHLSFENNTEISDERDENNSEGTREPHKPVHGIQIELTEKVKGHLENEDGKTLVDATKK